MERRTIAGVFFLAAVLGGVCEVTMRGREAVAASPRALLLVPEEQPIAWGSAEMEKIIFDAATDAGQDPMMLKALAFIESSHRPHVKAENPHKMREARKRTSDLELQRELTRAHGLMQILGITAFDYGVMPEELRDPWNNVRLGSLIFGDCLRREKGNTKRALACYYGGPRTKKKPMYRAEHFAYAERVITKWKEMRNHGKTTRRRNSNRNVQASSGHDERRLSLASSSRGRSNRRNS